MFLRVFLLSAVFRLPEGVAFQSLGTKRTVTRYSTATSSAVAEAPVTEALATESRCAPSEVVSMFDEFSSYFEERLVDDLEYTAPRDVAEAATKRVQDEGRQGRLYSSAIDAGCGTGLIGPYLREIVDGPMVGVDLSPKMAELAAELVVDDGPTPMVKNRMRRCDEMARTAQGINRLYDGVFTGDLLNLDGAKILEGYGHDMGKFPKKPWGKMSPYFPKKPVELIVCADVLCYFGDMREVLQVFSDRLVEGGDLIFSTETMAQGDYNWVQLVSERYAHSPEYVHRMAVKAGLSRVSQLPFTPRMEAGEKVYGTLHTYTKKKK